MLSPSPPPLERNPGINTGRSVNRTCNILAIPLSEITPTIACEHNKLLRVQIAD